ncbi:MAG: hypothetical protein ACI8PZ_007513, partial [Myxococcota bacterium]
MIDAQGDPRMYTSRKVRRAVQEMSDEDFAFLMEDL